MNRSTECRKDAMGCATIASNTGSRIFRKVNIQVIKHELADHSGFAEAKAHRCGSLRSSQRPLPEM